MIALGRENEIGRRGPSRPTSRGGRGVGHLPVEPRQRGPTAARRGGGGPDDDFVRLPGHTLAEREARDLGRSTDDVGDRGGIGHGASRGCPASSITRSEGTCEKRP